MTFRASEDGTGVVMDLYCKCTKIGTVPIHSGFNYDVFKGLMESDVSVALNLPRDFRQDRKAMELQVSEIMSCRHYPHFLIRPYHPSVLFASSASGEGWRILTSSPCTDGVDSGRMRTCMWLSLGVGIDDRAKTQIDSSYLVSPWLENGDIMKYLANRSLLPRGLVILVGVYHIRLVMQGDDTYNRSKKYCWAFNTFIRARFSTAESSPQIF